MKWKLNFLDNVDMSVFLTFLFYTREVFRAIDWLPLPLIIKMLEITCTEKIGDFFYGKFDELSDKIEKKNKQINKIFSMNKS